MQIVKVSHDVYCEAFWLSVDIVTTDLKLLPSAGSDCAWVWNTQADFADEEAKPEQLAIRFGNAESEWLFLKYFYYLLMWKYVFN